MNQIILVVEDHNDLREEVALVLQSEGYTVYTAVDGREAMDRLAENQWRPDLIVSDIAMPRMDGYEFFIAVHAIRDFRAIPFIFLTARGTRRDKRIGSQLGVDDYLVKPFEPEDFLAAVQNRLRRASEIRAQAAHELDDARRTMVQLLSHELRTPLTYVTGGFSLLAEELDHNMSPDAEISLGLIRSGTNRLNRLAEQMVLFAELVSGHVQWQLDTVAQPINVADWVQSVLNLHHQDAEERQITVTVHDDANEPLMVYGLINVLTSALGEVVRNAISYSAEGASVQVRIGQVQDSAVVQVIDQGRGIVAEDVPHVWSILMQSQRKQHEQQGAGMGLPIARKAIEAHGGTITLESLLEAGTTVTIGLPLYVAEHS